MVELAIGDYLYDEHGDNLWDTRAEAEEVIDAAQGVQGADKPEGGNTMNLVEQAITEHWGERCDGYEQGCPVCDAWREYDNLVIYGETLNKVSQVDNNLFIEELMRPPVDVAIRNAVSKLIVEGRIHHVDNKSR